MATTPTGEYEKKILIALESTMSGVTDTLAALEAMRKKLGAAEGSTKSLDKAYDKASKTLKDTEKSVRKYNKSLTITKTLQKGLYETMRGVGKITRTAFGAATVALGAFAIETKRIGNTMLQFKISSLDSSKAIEKLGSAYGNLSVQSRTAVMAMEDVAEVIAKFQSKSIAHMSLMMKDGVKSGIMGIQSVIKSVQGKDAAAQMMEGFLGSMENEFGKLEEVLPDLGGIARQIQDTLNDAIKVQLIDDFVLKFRELRKYTDDLGTAAQPVLNAFKTLREYILGGGDDVVRATIAMNISWGRLTTVLKNLHYSFVETFGPDLAGIIEGVQRWLEMYILANVEKIEKGVRDLKSRFVEWGGTARLIETMNRVLNIAWKTIVRIVEIGADVIDWLRNANDATKILAGSMAAIVLAPNLLVGVIALGHALSMVSIRATAAAAATKGLAGIGAGLVGKAAGYGLIAGGATLGHLGGKALGGYAGAEQGGLAEALSGAAGAAAAGAVVGLIIPVIGPAIGAAVAGVGSLIVSAIGAWGDDTKEAVKKQFDPRDFHITQLREHVKKLEADIEKIESDSLKRLAKATEKAGEEAKEAEDHFNRFVEQLKKLDTFTKKTAPGYTKAIGGMLAIADALGPSTEIFGEKISNILQRFAVEEMAHGVKGLHDSIKTATEAMAELNDPGASAEDKARAMERLGFAMDGAEKAVGLFNQALEAALKPLEKQLEVISAIKEIRQLDLDISQQLYGTPALAVQAQLELVKVMQAEKETLEAQLSVTQGLIAAADQMKLTEKDIFFLRMKELDLSKKIKGVTRDQLRQVKELRDGYLDAVTAQAFGAGKFSKLLITQDQNLGRGLMKGVVKPNFLLGQVGAAAGAYNADPYRHSAQGMGYLETLGGQVMSPEDISKTIYDRLSGDGPGMAAARQGADAFLNIMSGANKNTRDLGNIAVLVGERQVDATKEGTDAINAWAEKLHSASATAAALSGAPAGATVLGAAMRRQGAGQPLPPLTNEDYVRQAQQQGSSTTSINALLAYRRTARNIRRGAPPGGAVGAVGVSGAPGAPQATKKSWTPVIQPSEALTLDVERYSAASQKTQDAEESIWRAKQKINSSEENRGKLQANFDQAQATMTKRLARRFDVNAPGFVPPSLREDNSIQFTVGKSDQKFMKWDSPTREYDAEKVRNTPYLQDFYQASSDLGHDDIEVKHWKNVIERNEVKLKVAKANQDRIGAGINPDLARSITSQQEGRFSAYRHISYKEREKEGIEEGANRLRGQLSKIGTSSSRDPESKKMIADLIWKIDIENERAMGVEWEIQDMKKKLEAARASPNNVPEVNKEIGRLKQKEADIEAALLLPKLGPEIAPAVSKGIKQAVAVGGGAVGGGTAEAGQAHPNLRGIPTLTAVDTDRFMGGRRAQKTADQLKDKMQFSRSQGPRLPQEERRKRYLIEMERQKVLGPKREAERREKYLKTMERQKVLGTERREKHLGAMERQKQLASLPKREPGSPIMPRQLKDIERKKQIEETKQKALGRYNRMEEIKRKALEKQRGLGKVKPGDPTAKLPKYTGPLPPSAVRGPRSRVGVSSPGTTRQLSHGNVGNFASKAKDMKQLLVQVGQGIEELGAGMDEFNEGQDNVTQYASNRLHSTYPMATI